MNVVDLGDRKKEIKAHAWERAGGDWYQEPAWCSARLFDEEPFEGSIWDPACGGGNIIDSALTHDYAVAFSDIEIRGGMQFRLQFRQRDFFTINEPCDNIVTNPPFKMAGQFFHKAMSLARGKVAMILPTARLNAAYPWLDRIPLRTLWLMTPRPSMPPGSALAAGAKAKGGWTDYCWLVWDKNYFGRTDIRWLHRDRKKQ